MGGVKLPLNIKRRRNAAAITAATVNIRLNCFIFRVIIFNGLYFYCKGKMFLFMSIPAYACILMFIMQKLAYACFSTFIFQRFYKFSE
jgi:hypothetical protein